MEGKGDKHANCKERYISRSQREAIRLPTLTKVWLKVADGTELYFLMPSIVAPGSWAQLQEMRAGTKTGKKERSPLEKDLVISYGGIEHFAGWLAYYQLREATTGLGDELRYYSDEALMRCLAAACAAIEEYEEELEQHRRMYGYEEPAQPDDVVRFPIIHVSLVSSVPVKYYNSKNRKEIKSKFNGSHHCEVNGIKRDFHISYKQTIMEGGGLEILAAEMPDVDLARRSDNITIDGGGDTVDFVKLSSEDVIYEQCGTVRNGVERIADLVSSSMLRDYKRNLLPRERQAILNGFVSFRRFGVIEDAYPEIAIDANDPSFVLKEKLHKWVEAARRQVTRQIISKASSLWGAADGKVAPDILRGHAFFIGGQTYLTDDLIKEAIPQLIVPSQPELANARANAYIARALSEE
jgi:Actin like proteins N terminal domain